MRCAGWPARMSRPLLAVALLALLSATPVQAQTAVWSATLTVKEPTSGTLGCVNGFSGASCSDSAVLSDDDFTHASTTYAVTHISLSSTSLGFNVDTTFATATRQLTLEVDGELFALADGGSGNTSLRWSDPDLSWAVNDTATLRLINLRDQVPLAPATPTVAAVRDTLTVSWTAPTNTGRPAIANYDIQYATSRDGPWTAGQYNFTGGTSTTFTGLQPDTPYWVRVRARNSNGASPWSDLAQSVDASTVPDAPTALAATPGGPDRINLSWTAPTNDGGRDISGYQVERSDDGTSDWTVITPDTGSSTTSSADTGLPASTTRHYRVSAINAVGTGSPSNVAMATTPAAEDLAAWFLDLPTTHDGRTRFVVIIAFNATLDLADEADFAQAVSVTGGTVESPGRVGLTNSWWKVVVRPSSPGPITVTVAGNRTCTQTGAVCATDGRQLSHTLSGRVTHVVPRLAVTVPAGAPPVEGAPAMFRVLRIGPHYLADAVDISLRVTQSGDFLAGSPPATVTIPRNAESHLLSLATVDDQAAEAHGAVTVTLLGAAHYEIDASADSATVQVRDNDGGGPPNTAPTAAHGAVTTPADTAYIFRAADFGFMDSDPGATLASVTVVTLPAAGRGRLQLNGANASAPAVVTTTQLENGHLTYRPPPGQSGTAYASFTFTVNDGTTDSTAPSTMTINIGRGGRGGSGGGGPVIAEEAPDLIGSLENPGPDSFQSGIRVISGWVCEAEAVEAELGHLGRQTAAYGTERLDTQAVCGDTDNGFGVLFNWNLLGDGEHEVVAYVDDVELGRATVTVTTLGAEFVRDIAGTCAATDFPSPGETVTVAWQQSQQNFVLVDGERPQGTTRAGRAGVGYLENPGSNSFQSGLGVISGWVCEGEAVEIEIGALDPQRAAYGTERLDTESVCGDADNGFGLLFNWNLLGDGEHEIVAFVDDVELGRATVTVTTLGEEFLQGVEGECTVENFPGPDETVTLEWQQNKQNFVIIAVE